MNEEMSLGACRSCLLHADQHASPALRTSIQSPIAQHPWLAETRGCPREGDLGFVTLLLARKAFAEHVICVVPNTSLDQQLPAPLAGSMAGAVVMACHQMQYLQLEPMVGVSVRSACFRSDQRQTAVCRP